MKFTLGNYELDIDVDKTRRFYEQSDEITDGCSCDGCRNYELATHIFPEPVKEFFEKIGVDTKKAAEIMVWCAEDGGKSLYYGGFYHICGKILSDTNYWKLSESMNMSEVYAPDDGERYSITDGYSVGFTDGVALLEPDFPSPVLQMEIEFHVPWLLEHKNTYR